RWIERGTGLQAEPLAALRELLWQAAGPVREASRLRDAWRVCAAMADAGWQARLAKSLLRAARLRRRSLGAHCREDHGCPV
ncbi:MAG: L-aspartate oxidase, partial [Rhodanobacter sp.]